MQLSHLVPACALLAFAVSGTEAHGFDVPADYPSHHAVGGCHQQHLSEMQRELGVRLDDYNHVRLDVAQMLRDVVRDYHLTGDERTRLLGFADNFDSMAAHLPAPDPDSSEFRNFDFQVGISFASVAVHLNENQALADRFRADQREPSSAVGRYMARLNASKEAYFSTLEHFRADSATAAASGCS